MYFRKSLLMGEFELVLLFLCPHQDLHYYFGLLGICPASRTSSGFTASQVQGDDNDPEYTGCLLQRVPSARYRFVIDRFGRVASALDARRRLLNGLLFSRAQFSELGYPVEGTVSRASVSCTMSISCEITLPKDHTF